MFKLSALGRSLGLMPAIGWAQPTCSIQTTLVVERARRGTRERKRKVALANKKKKEERLRKNPPPIPYKVELMLKSKGLWGPPKPLRAVEDGLTFAADDLYFVNDFAYARYSLDEAVENIREMFDPTIYNEPDVLIEAKVEFDMRGTKKDRYIDEFSKMVPILKAYDRKIPDRNVLAFVPNEEMRLEAMAAGAMMAGGQDLITEVSKGRVDVAAIDNFIAHEELAGSLRPLMAVLRDKCPSVSNGTIGSDIPRLIQTFGKGMLVEVKKVKPAMGVADEPDYGFCTATIGRLDMDTADIMENLSALMSTVNEEKPNRKDDTGFITRVQIYAAPSVDVEITDNDKFSIVHPTIYDTRVDEQEKTVREGRLAISQAVAELKSEQA